MVSNIIPWHEHIWQQWLSYLKNQMLPNALLLFGIPGLGKQTFARRIINNLLCTNPISSGDACEACHSCYLFKAGSHPDFIMLDSNNNKSISIEKIRELQEIFNFTASCFNYKVALINNADYLSTNSANCLLKTMEEPPGKSLLILVSNQLSSVPITIRSRCRLVRFSIPDRVQATTWLTKLINNNNRAQLLLNIAGGAPLVALNLADLKCWNQRYRLIENYIQFLSGKLEFVHIAKLWMEGKLFENTNWLMSVHTDIIRISLLPNLDLCNSDMHNSLICNSDMYNLLKSLIGKFPLMKHFEFLDYLLKINSLYSRSNVNIQMILESYLVSIAQLF